jgi:cyclohexadieny/prephenate dehydrogenase
MTDRPEHGPKAGTGTSASGEAGAERRDGACAPARPAAGEKPRFGKVALIGLGLIGSSLSHVIRREGLAQTISGAARSVRTLSRARELGLADELTRDPAAAVREADLVFLNVPVGSMGEVARKIAPALKPGAILTDVGSVKQAVIRDVSPHVPEGVHFIPGHPIAGTEQSGPDAGFAELFENRWCILTPLENTDPAALERLKAFWTACGSNVELMDPAHHDLVLGITSHLPHLIAYNIVATAADLEQVTESEVIKYSAGGFRDFTRLAASDPVMWRDVFLNNREAVLELLGRFMEDLHALQRAIRWGEGDKLYELFSRSRRIRREIIEAGQDTPAPNFGRR